MLVIPQKQAETLRNTEQTLQAEGSWKGSFEDFSLREGEPSSPKTGVLLKGYVGPTAKRVSITIGDNVPLDGQAEMGARKVFVDLTLEDGPYSLDDTPYDEIPREAWQLQRSARIVANLAAALGQITFDGDNATVNDGFLDALESGVYGGTEIGYVIYHRTGSDKVVRSEIEQFMVV